MAARAVYAFDVAIIERIRPAPIPRCSDSFAELPEKVTAEGRDLVDLVCNSAAYAALGA